MNRLPNPSLSRRALLRNGGIAISMGAVVAACGSDRSGPTNPGRIGVADPAPTLPTAEVNDVVLLRTAQSIEHTAVDVYADALELGVLSDDEVELLTRFSSDHEAHSARIGELIAGAGGEAFTCANPFLVDRVVDPVMAAIAESSDPHRDLLQVAYAFESFAGASYQAITSSISAMEMRSAVIAVGTEEHRHAAVLAATVDPDKILAPELTGGTEEMDPDGLPYFYVVPSTFGQLTGVPLSVGEPNEEGARTSVSLQTPAENSYVYEYLTCEG